MRKVLSLILSAALSLSVFFAVPILPNGNLPTDPTPGITENGEGDDGNQGGAQDSGEDGSGIAPQDIGLPAGGEDI